MNIRALPLRENFSLFVKISRWKTFSYVLLSLAADSFRVVAPAFLIYIIKLSSSKNPKAPWPVDPYLIEGHKGLMFGFLITFILFVLGQALIFYKTYIIRSIDKVYIKNEANKIVSKYENRLFYQRGDNWMITRPWFSKNILRNTRHKSEAMQAILKMVPDIISIVTVIISLIFLDMLAGLVAPIMICAAALIMSHRTKDLFLLSANHFRICLPKLSVGIQRKVSAIYDLPRQIKNTASYDPEYDDYVKSRYNLAVLKAKYSFLASVVVGGFFLAFLAVLFLSNDFFMATVEVVIVMHLIHKSSSLLGSLGSIARLGPQIDMAKQIDRSLDASDDDLLFKNEREYIEVVDAKLHQFINIYPLKSLDRFSIIDILNNISKEYKLSEAALPLSKAVFCKGALFEEHALHFDIDQKKNSFYIAYDIVQNWINEGMKIIIADNQFLRILEVNGLKKIFCENENIMFIVTSIKPLPKRWTNNFSGIYNSICYSGGIVPPDDFFDDSELDDEL